MQVLRPDTTEEALRLLAAASEDTKIIAGGTAVMLMMRNGLLFPDRLISVDRLSDLDYIEPEPEGVRLGALTSLRRMERSDRLGEVLPTLRAAVGLVANHRVRQRATIGGNLAESDYASDPPAVLTTLGCQVQVTSGRGRRWVPVEEFLVGFYETVLTPDELVTEVWVPRPSPSARSLYLKYISRAAEDRPCLGVAAHVDIDESGRYTDARVSVAGATATPFTLTEATEQLRGATADDGAWRAVADAYRQAIRPIDDVRGGASYRKHVTGELVGRALRMVSTTMRSGAIRL